MKNDRNISEFLRCKRAVGDVRLVNLISLDFIQISLDFIQILIDFIQISLDFNLILFLIG
jgi:hypothetical protein